MALRLRAWLRASAVAAVVLIAAASIGALIAAEPATPTDALDDDPGTALGLFAHNAAVALWPLALLALGWDRIGPLASLADGLIVASLAVNGVQVGRALSAAGAELWPYLPHLPAEWIALALPAGCWFAFRRSAPRERRPALAIAAGATVAALAVAAVLETYVPPLGA
jgi:hypothetical protein